MSSISRARHEIYSATVFQLIQLRNENHLNEELITQIQKDAANLDAMFQEFQMYVAMAKKVWNDYEKYMVQARTHLRKTKKQIKIKEQKQLKTTNN